MTYRRAALAGLLSVLYPGLGHVYLRAWWRAVAWSGLAILTATLVVPDSLVAAFQSGGLDAFLEASRDLPSETVLALSSIRALNAIDAAWLALSGERSGRGRGRGQGQDPEGASCPHCGGELDADLDFCPWCTTYLAGVEGAPDGSAPER